MDKNTKDILETVNFIKDRMLTKDDVRDITREVIREEVPANDPRRAQADPS